MSDRRRRNDLDAASGSARAAGSAPTSSPPADAVGVLRNLGDRRGGAGRGRTTTARSSACSSTPAWPGICVPEEYGGQGLTPAHQQVLNEELRGYEYPIALPGADVRAVPGGAARLRHRGAEAAAHPRRSSRARSSGCSSSPSRAAAPTSPARSPPPCATATSGSSTARRSGRPARGGPTGACAWPAPTGTSRSTVASRVFMFPIHQPGIEVQRIEMLNGQGVLPGVPDRRAGPRHATASARSTTAGPSAPAGCSTSGCAQLAARHHARPAARARRRRDAAILDGRPAHAGRLDDPASATCSARLEMLDLGRRRSSSSGIGHGIATGTHVRPVRRRSAGSSHGVRSAARSATIAFELAGADRRRLDRRRRRARPSAASTS